MGSSGSFRAVLRLRLQIGFRTVHRGLHRRYTRANVVVCRSRRALRRILCILRVFASFSPVASAADDDGDDDDDASQRDGLVPGLGLVAFSSNHYNQFGIIFLAPKLNLLLIGVPSALIDASSIRVLHGTEINPFPNGYRFFRPEF